MKIKLIFGLIVFVFATLLFRLIDIQLINGSVYEKLANNNKTYRVIFPEERGVFLDRYNQSMVYNKPVYYKLDSSESLYSDRTRITHDEALQVMSQDSDLIRIELERMYLYPKSMAHVLGYVGSVSLEELASDSSLYISDRVGKFGLEKELQSFLRGSKSSQLFEVNALGEKQRLISEDDGVPGRNVPTTLDPYLSEVALRAMGDNKGAVVILDSSNSEVLSLVSTPSFDSSVLSESFADEESERIRVRTIQDFLSNPQKLFFNRVVSGAYPPGSIFKIITSLAGLEGNKINKETTVIDEGTLKVGEYSYANWYFTQYGLKEGEISLLRAITRSNDIYFYKVAEWVGPEKLKEMATLFALGEKSGIQLQAEIEGVVPDPEWKQRVIGERWFLGNTYHMGIGQGDILVTPIQIAQLVQAVANNGNLCKATLIKDSFDLGNVGLSSVGGIFGKSRCKEVGVLEENINLVLEGMLGACSSGGTGFSFFENNTAVFKKSLSVKDQLDNGAVACKTGTSEFGGVDDRGYRKTHGWFAAVMGTKALVSNALKERREVWQELEEVLSDTSTNKSESLIDRDLWLDGVEKYGFPDEIVVIVLVESDELSPYKEGSRDAGPVAKEIFDWIKGEVDKPFKHLTPN